MDDVPPPTDHTLRPHHVGLLVIFIAAFKETDVKQLPPPFALHLYRIMLNEVSQPRMLSDVIRELASGPRADAEESRKVFAAIQTLRDGLVDAEKVTVFFGCLPSLFLEKSDDLRRSLFGVIELQSNFQLWCAGNFGAGYEPAEKDSPLTADHLIYKTQANKKTSAKPEAYEAWEKGQSIGDENIATENLHRFFEQHFHENNDSGVRQHALLNLVRMHYTRGEYVAASKLLSEAITVARTSGDKSTLQHCMSLLHRLPPNLPKQKPVLNEVQPDLHPLEIMFDVSKLLDEQNDQPLSASFAKLFQAMGLYDHWLDVQLAVPIEEEQWAQHAVQSVLWATAGCTQLASIEEDLVIAFTEPGSEDINRTTVILNKSYKMARQGQYKKSLAMLLDPSVWRGLSIQQYTSWAQEVWHVLAMRATRRGQDRLFQGYLIPRRPPGPFNMKHYYFDIVAPTMSKTREPLYRVLEMRQHDQAAAAIEHLLKALWHSEFLLHLNEYRNGIILLADVGLEFKLSHKCRQILDEVLPQIIAGNDLEQRAVACFTFARCIIVSESIKPYPSLEEALPYLLMAESDFITLEIYRSVMDVQYMLSVVYQSVNRQSERDDAANRYQVTETQRQKMEKVGMDKEVQQILEFVASVGSMLTSR